MVDSSGCGVSLLLTAPYIIVIVYFVLTLQTESLSGHQIIMGHSIAHRLEMRTLEECYVRGGAHIANSRTTIV